jgi:hypothetical protein
MTSSIIKPSSVRGEVATARENYKAAWNPNLMEGLAAPYATIASTSSCTASGTSGMRESSSLPRA